MHRGRRQEWSASQAGTKKQRYLFLCVSPPALVLQCKEQLSESKRKAAGARQKLEWAGEERLRLKRQSEQLGEERGKEGIFLTSTNKCCDTHPYTAVGYVPNDMQGF